MDKKVRDAFLRYVAAGLDILDAPGDFTPWKIDGPSGELRCWIDESNQEHWLAPGREPWTGWRPVYLGEPC